MGKPVIVAFPTDEDWRRQMASEAVSEMFTIISVFDREKDDAAAVSLDDLWRGTFLRFDTLASVAMDALNASSPRDSQELADELYGCNGWVVAEQRHDARVQGGQEGECE